MFVFSQAPSEPKTFANLFKNPGAYNGLPSTVPPFGSAKSAPTSAAATPATQVTINKEPCRFISNINVFVQTNSEPTSTSTNINGNENFPAAVPSQQQRNNYRSARPAAAMGNGRGGGSGPGSYHNRDRDQDRGMTSFCIALKAIVHLHFQCRRKGRKMVR